MKTVPTTSFVIKAEDGKSMLNLLDCAADAVHRGDKAEALRYVQDAEAIAADWAAQNVGSLAHHVLKRLSAMREALE